MFIKNFRNLPLIRVNIITQPVFKSFITGFCRVLSRSSRTKFYITEISICCFDACCSLSSIRPSISKFKISFIHTDERMKECFWVEGTSSFLQGRSQWTTPFPLLMLRPVNAVMNKGEDVSANWKALYLNISS